MNRLFDFRPIPKKGLSSKFPRLKIVKRVNGLLYYKQRRVYVPEGELRTRLMREFHDTPSAGHCGVFITIKKLSKEYYWLNLKGDVEKYVASCTKCQMNKASTQKIMGLLSPLSISKQPYRCLSMDFMTSLPQVQGYDSIFVIVNRFSKLARFIPTKWSEGAEKTAKLFYDPWFCQIGYPEDIVSDRDAQFLTTFWQHMIKRSGTKLILTIAFHPQGDGQTEMSMPLLICI